MLGQSVREVCWGFEKRRNRCRWDQGRDRTKGEKVRNKRVCAGREEGESRVSYAGKQLKGESYAQLGLTREELPGTGDRVAIT